MDKNLYLLLPVLIFSIAIFGFEANNSNRKNQLLIVPIATPTPNQTSESSEIVIDKEKVCQPLPPGFKPAEGRECVDKDMTVKVSATKPENKQLKYEYTVTGGRIIGEGANVVWDLEGGQPGTYQIRIDISNKATGEKRSEIKAVDLIDTVPSCSLCDCPEISVNAPQSLIKAGDTMIFSANVSGGSQPDVTYSWTVSDGEIVEGQGTPSISVATNSKMAGKNVKATVEIGGICEDCQDRIESATPLIAKTKRSKK